MPCFRLSLISIYSSHLRMILNLKVHLISSFRCKFYLQPVVQVSDLSTALGVFNEKWTITDTTDDSLEH